MRQQRQFALCPGWILRKFTSDVPHFHFQFEQLHSKTMNAWNNNYHHLKKKQTHASPKTCALKAWDNRVWPKQFSPPHKQFFSTNQPNEEELFTRIPEVQGSNGRLPDRLSHRFRAQSRTQSEGRLRYCYTLKVNHKIKQDQGQNDK